MLSFVYGTKNSSKSEYLTEKITRCLKEGNRVMLIVPERRSVVTEHRMISSLPGTLRAELEVLSFRRLCNRVFREYGGISHQNITKEGKTLILWRVLTQIAPHLSVYSHLDLDSRPVIETLLDTLTTLDRAALSNKTLSRQAERAAEHGNHALCQKLNDLVLIRSAFKTVLSRDFDDPEEELARLGQLLDIHPFFKDYHVFIDETNSFSGNELTVLRRILSQSPEVTVTLGRLPKDHRDVCRKLIWCEKALRREADNAACPVRTEAVLEDVGKGSAALAFLRTHLFSSKKETFVSSEGIDLVTCTDAASEAEMIACAILDNVQNGSRWRDHAIALRDTEAYKGILDRRLQAAGIPFYFADKRPLAAQNAVKGLLLALNTVSDNYRLKDICAYMRSGYTTLSFEETCLLEEYAKIWQIEGAKWRSDRPFCMNPKGRSIGSDEETIKKLERLNDIKCRLILPLEELAADQKGVQTVKDRVASLYRFYEKNEYPVRILEAAHQKNNSGDSTGAMHLCQTNDLICQCFDELWETVGDMPCSLSLFTKMFTTSIEGRNIGSIPQKSDEVLITDVFSLGSSHYPHLFLPGLIDGVFPSSAGGDGLFNNSELKFLSEDGIDLPGMYEQRCADEFFAFEEAIGAAQTHLTLSYPQRDSAANGTSPSLFFDAVRALIPSLSFINYQDLPAKRRLGSKQMLYNLYLSGKAGENAPVFEEVFGSALSPVSYGGGLDSAFAHTIYENALLLSQSKLEKFIECPFAYTCRYLFGLQSDPVAETAANEYGTLMHAVFEEVLGDLSRKGDPATASDEELKKAIGKKIEDFRHAILGQSEDIRTLHLLRRAGATAYLLLAGMRDEFQNSRFRPIFFELPFGLTQKDGGLSLPAMEFFKDEKFRAALRGIADRVDLYKQGDTVYFRIVDYKTGNKEFDQSELKHGLSGQMLLYMRAVCTTKDPAFLAAIGADENTKLVPAGIVYCIAKRPKLTVRPGMGKDEILSAAKGEIARHGIAIDEPDLIAALDTSLDQSYLPTGKGKRMSREEFDDMLESLPQTLGEVTKKLYSGNADIDPLCEGKQDACRYCDFRAVCRQKNKNNKEGDDL